MKAEFRKSIWAKDFDMVVKFDIFDTINANKVLIDAANFDALYQKFYDFDKTYLTYVLLNSNINPLIYLTKSIPTEYMNKLKAIPNCLMNLNPKITEIGANAFNGCGDFGDADLSNIIKIGETAFQKCSFNKLIISDYLEQCSLSAFYEAKIDTIVFKGEKDIFMQFFKYFFSQSIVNHVIFDDGTEAGSEIWDS